jgi:hypothetical protein
MILLTVALAFFRQNPEWDQSLNGVWIADEVKPVIIQSGLDEKQFGLIWIDEQDSFTDMPLLTAVDNGGFYSHWLTSRKMYQPSHNWNWESSRAAAKPIQVTTKSGKGYYLPWSIPGVFRPDSAGYTGEVRLFPEYTTNGAFRAKLELYDQRAVRTRAMSLKFLGKSPLINVKGTYKDSTVSMTLDESDGRSQRSVEGTLTVFGITYTLVGYRAWSRTTYTLYNRETRAEAGHGWTSWWPTRDGLEKIRSDNSAPTDRLLIGLWLNSGGFPTGVQKVLSLSNPN